VAFPPESVLSGEMNARTWRRLLSGDEFHAESGWERKLESGICNWNLKNEAVGREGTSKGPVNVNVHKEPGSEP
jgi:hypothetical protein